MISFFLRLALALTVACLLLAGAALALGCSTVTDQIAFEHSHSRYRP